MSRMLATILMTAALAIGAPAAAHAERWTSADPAGDAVSWDANSNDPCAPEAFTAAPNDRASDLTRVRVAHSHEAVQLGATFRGVTGSASRSAAFYVDTPGRSYIVDVLRYTGPGWPQPPAVAIIDTAPRSIETASCEDLTGVDSSDGSSARRPAGCRRPRVHVDGPRVTVRVPRECLGTPRWVQVGAFATSADEGDDVLGFDTWLPAGQEASGFAVGAVGPRVRPGPATP